MTDYDVALTIYDKIPEDITEISSEEAKQFLDGLCLDDGEMDDIDLDDVVEYVNEWLKEDVA